MHLLLLIGVDDYEIWDCKEATSHSSRLRSDSLWNSFEIVMMISVFSMDTQVYIKFSISRCSVSLRSPSF